MIRFHTLVASVLGIGYVGKGGGTVAAVVYCMVWLVLPGGYDTGKWQVAATILIILAGTWSAGVVDSIWGRDNSKVVIDEVAGMAIALLYVPQDIAHVLVSLVAFRFFDIIKPLGIRKAEMLPKGWGVMADDLLAGLYALAVIHLWMLIENKFG